MLPIQSPDRTMSGGGGVGRMTEAEQEAEFFEELRAAVPRGYADVGGW